MSGVTAGALEEYLRRNGQAAMGRIEDQARADPKFREALAGVYPGWVSDDVFGSIRVAAGLPPLGSPEQPGDR